MMNEVVTFLQENPVQYLATVGRDGKPKCRPFMFCFEREGKLWFCTNNTKEVYKDLQENPYVEVSTSSPAYAWIRLSGKAVFADDRAAKEGCMENPIVKGQYQSADNPIFVVFYLEGAKAVLADFSGNPPREYTL
ncbi:pyridoxamine 5'-phosphate oxidase family protein [Clostridium sp. ATCC 29733]|nr:pyridoxamine 5'-phosphate oxidase family protein [Clostridium sp. ATCC 29733]